MSGEKGSRSLLRVALENGLFPRRVVQNIGGFAFRRANEFYLGKPQDAEPHIAERIKTEIAVNEARVGEQFVEIASMIDPSNADSRAEEREMVDRRRGYRLYGHTKIVKALLEADTDPSVSEAVEQQVVDIAHGIGTNPSKLESMLSEHERERAQRILEI